ncbi:pancreatic lipase-related protein 2 [Ixodes scapularis]|uniref:pancreatic lipase-related protein 2 n=1 Tax=Ixodes scapularis TaxID=6945 RepID=UPI001C3818C5|nr:pancreatic lipase-related protein 2 [Ixodes scapularis]
MWNEKEEGYRGSVNRFWTFWEAFSSILEKEHLHRQDPVFLDYTSASKQEKIPNWRIKRPLKIIVHGWRDNTNSSWIHDMKDALLQEEDCNVIIVDWSRGAKTLNYVFAAGNSALVGRQLSLLTQRLLKAYGLNASRVHCIGHSLGGHAAGFFGRHFKEKTSMLIGRISALDVAEPLFSDSGVSVSSQDAQFVDVIHTSESHWYIRSGVGMTKPFGHVDFYPNFGERQPGCPLMDIICDHDRSVYYFMESITNKQCHFKSKPCDETSLYIHEKNCVGSGASGEMGYFSPHAAGRGVQYLATNNKSPYCKNNQYRGAKLRVNTTNRFPMVNVHRNLIDFT